MWKSFFILSSSALVVSSFAGCQTWSPGAFPLQNMSRVSPPATGTYPLPNGYYNNSTSSLNNGSQAMTASATPNRLDPVGGGLPVNRLAAQATASSSVIPAQFASSPSNSVTGSFQPPSNTLQSNSPVATAGFTGGVTGNSVPGESSFQAGNFATRDYQGAAVSAVSDVPDVTADPDLQWRP